ncbi:MAG: hypothetical protein EXR71_12645 [Myxococcales bacterium]|nr:hypothetical protein [Myxococcales bacterium]
MLCFLACTDTPDPAPERVPHDESTLSTPPLAMELDPADIAPLALDGLSADLITPYAALHWFEALLFDLGAGGEGCPHYTPSPFDPLVRLSEWQGRCEGVNYSIAGGWLYQDRHERIDDDHSTHAAQMLVSFAGQGDAGEVSAGGWTELDWTVAPEGRALTLVIEATFVDASADVPWPGGIRGGTTWAGTLTDRFTGTVSGPTGTAAAELYLDELEVADSVVIAGRLGVRDPSTAWWWWSFSPEGDATLSEGGRVEAGLGLTLGAVLTDVLVRDIAAAP